VLGTLEEKSQYQQLKVREAFTEFIEVEITRDPLRI
jgi:hypothetical protein